MNNKMFIKTDRLIITDKNCLSGEEFFKRCQVAMDAKTNNKTYICTKETYICIKVIKPFM